MLEEEKLKNKWHALNLPDALHDITEHDSTSEKTSLNDFYIHRASLKSFNEKSIVFDTNELPKRKSTIKRFEYVENESNLTYLFETS